MDLSIGTDIGVADLLAVIALAAVVILAATSRMGVELAIVLALMCIAIIVVA